MLPAFTSHLGTVPYAPTADLQRGLRAAREADVVPDVLLTLEHDPVITTGTRTEPHEVAAALLHDVPIVDTERGGKATYHGPGQLVAYPVFRLRDHGDDVRAFVRTLEQVVIDVIGRFGVEGERRDGYPGVWAANGKIASLGLRVTRGITFHGLAINVDVDLTPFSWFTPCGIPDVTMSSLRTELGSKTPRMDEVRTVLLERFADRFGMEFDEVEADTLRELAPPIAAPVLPPRRRAEPITLTLDSVDDSPTTSMPTVLA